MLGSALLFGTTGTAQALGPAAPPAAVGAARVVVGAAALVLAAAVTGALTRRMRGGGPGVLVAAAGVAGYQVCFFAGVARTGVAIGTIVAIGSAPAVTGLLDLVVRRERPERRWALATALAVAGGALLIASGGEGEHAADPVGVLLALGAGASYAVYTVAAKGSLDRGREPLAVMASAFGLGAVLLAPVLAVADVGWLARTDGILLAAYLGLGPTALAYVLFARGLRRLAPRTVATLTLAEPLTAAALGVVVLGERPPPVGIAGAALVLLGLLTLAGRRDPRGAAAEPAAT